MSKKTAHYTKLSIKKGKSKSHGILIHAELEQVKTETNDKTSPIGLQINKTLSKTSSDPLENRKLVVLMGENEALVVQPKIERYLTLVSTKETSSKNEIASARPAMFKFKSFCRRFKVSKVCMAITTLLIVSLVFVSCVVFYFVNNMQPPLIPLDVYCKKLYGKCSYYRKKYVDNCSSETDFCSTIETMVDLYKETDHVTLYDYDEGINLNANISARLRFYVPPKRHRWLSIPDGAPCFLSGKQEIDDDFTAVGLCKSGRCVTPPSYEFMAGYIAENVTDGQWTMINGVNKMEDVPCLNVSRLPIVIRKYVSRYQFFCTNATSCPLYYLQFWSCTKPVPALGGHSCIKGRSLINGRFIPTMPYLPVKIGICQTCKKSYFPVTVPPDRGCGPCQFTVKTAALETVKNRAPNEWLVDENDFDVCCANKTYGRCIAGICIIIDEQK